ncbi:hypothetical protein [Paracoccus sp. (in: a-proteobacteria)]|uniref:hypothetical protein n=1 Tax=Paracoccus sp. TaxID=267 RepID=UPI003A83C8B8
MTTTASAEDVAAISAITGIPEVNLDVFPLEIPGLSGCAIFDALDTRVRGANAAMPVVRVDGGWLPGTAPDVTALVLNSCADRDTAPQALAAVIGTLHSPRLDAVNDVKSPLVETMLRNAGVGFQPPESRSEGSHQIVTFFAEGPDGQYLAYVEANWSVGGDVVVVANPIPNAEP